ncbi:hypothetical protein [Moritella sp. 28]|uniref:hypothetical protein n=1 Tax=Moritella sp. 28 TaxID=2746232 RepID=UPI001BA4D74C|nr:hypothetical protein [Moritella sp. 28]QUM85019.1 hypothetical protein HWV02_11185 [Moritella sp. 28]
MQLCIKNKLSIVSGLGALLGFISYILMSLMPSLQRECLLYIITPITFILALLFSIDDTMLLGNEKPRGLWPAMSSLSSCLSAISFGYIAFSSEQFTGIYNLAFISSLLIFIPYITFEFIDFEQNTSTNKAS